MTYPGIKINIARMAEEKSYLYIIFSKVGSLIKYWNEDQVSLNNGKCYTQYETKQIIVYTMQ